MKPLPLCMTMICAGIIGCLPMSSKELAKRNPALHAKIYGNQYVSVPDEIMMIDDGHGHKTYNWALAKVRAYNPNGKSTYRQRKVYGKFLRMEMRSRGVGGKYLKVYLTGTHLTISGDFNNLSDLSYYSLDDSNSRFAKELSDAGIQSVCFHGVANTYENCYTVRKNSGSDCLFCAPEPDTYTSTKYQRKRRGGSILTR